MGKIKGKFIENSTITEQQLNSSVNLSLDKADNSVQKTGNETIGGIKTFSSFPLTPSSAPTADYQVVNKKYVDDNAGGAMSWSAITADTIATINSGYIVNTDEIRVTIPSTMSVGDIIEIVGLSTKQFYVESSSDFDNLNLVNVWSTATDMTTSVQSMGGCGTQNAALASGGSSSSSTYEYNGTSWSSGGSLPSTMERHASCGTQNAALAFGGVYSTSTYNKTVEYNGTSWSSGGNLSSGKYDLAGAGTQNAALKFGGNSDTTITEEYNGTSWSSGGNLITGRDDLAGAGTQTAGLAFGGGNYMKQTEKYNGTSWSSGGNLIVGRDRLAGTGTQSAALSFGGSNTATTEEYNGSSWSTKNSLITATSSLAGAGTTSAALKFSGQSGGTEEFNPPLFTHVKLVASSANTSWRTITSN